MRSILAATAFLLLLCSGCATAINGRYETVPVDSFPRGANIEVACGNSAVHPGVTPASVRLERAAKECRLTLSKNGYDAQEVVFEKQTSRAMAANTIIGVPVGLVAAVGLAWIAPDEIASTGDVIVDSFVGGTHLGAAPGNQIDKHTGGAYKWVPGELFVVLIRSGRESSPAPENPR